MSQALPPIVAPDLKVLFVGINPGLRSAEVGHNFARPGTRFWGALHAFVGAAILGLTGNLITVASRIGR